VFTFEGLGVHPIWEAATTTNLLFVLAVLGSNGLRYTRIPFQISNVLLEGWLDGAEIDLLGWP